MAGKQLANQLSNRLYELEEDTILQLNEMEPSGFINNVVAGIEVEVFGVMLRSDSEKDIEFHLCYINGEEKLTGYALVLSLSLKKRNDLVLLFSKYLSEKYSEIDFVSTYNSYQHQIRTLFEKLGFWTFSESFVDKYQGKNADIIIPQTRGSVFVPTLQKLDVLKNLFGAVKIGQNQMGLEKIYLMYNVSNNFTKIGESKSPIYRERTLQAQEPDVHLIATWVASKELEKELHRKFRKKRERGEWFKLNMNDFLEIKELMENIDYRK